MLVEGLISVEDRHKQQALKRSAGGRDSIEAAESVVTELDEYDQIIAVGSDPDPGGLRGRLRPEVGGEFGVLIAWRKLEGPAGGRQSGVERDSFDGQVGGVGGGVGEGDAVELAGFQVLRRKDVLVVQSRWGQGGGR
ncbi:MAG: hypothetical protein Kow001_11770 [Acidobacteriota bacterium]